MPDGTVPCRPWRRQLPTPYQDAGQPSADPASRWRHADHDCQKSVQADMRASRCDMTLNDGELGLPAIGRVPGSMRVCSSCSGRHRGKQEGYLTPAASGAQAAFRTGPSSPAADAAGHLPRKPARAAQRTAMVPKTPSPSIWSPWTCPSHPRRRRWSPLPPGPPRRHPTHGFSPRLPRRRPVRCRHGERRAHPRPSALRSAITHVHGWSRPPRCPTVEPST